MKFNNSARGLGIRKDVPFNVVQIYADKGYEPKLENKCQPEIKFNFNDQLFMELLRMKKIRCKTISYASHRQKEINKYEVNLNAEINEFERNRSCRF